MAKITEYSFLMDVYDGGDDEPLHKGEMAGRLPPGAWFDAGHWLYCWNVKAAKLETAVRRAAKRCVSLRERTALEWFIDPDAMVVGGRKHDYVKVGNIAMLRAMDLVR